MASATVNTMQQVGGSIGTALLSTIAATAATSYLSDAAPTPQSQALAAVHGYTTTFWWSAAIFAAGAVISAFLLPGGKLPAATDAPEGQLVMAH